MESEALDRELIEALKRDGVERRAPAAARRRVAARLASAGAVGLGVSVAETARALAATSAGTTAVSGHATGGVASLTLGGLAKTLVVGMGLGASVGLGLHVASEHAAREVVVAAPPQRAATPAPHESTRARRDTSRAARETASSGTVAWLGPSGASSSDALAASAPNPAKHPLVSAGPARSAPHVEASVNPSPELPVAQPSAGSSGGLAEQQRLLDGARAALRQGNARAALGLVRAQRDAFPQTAFEEERELITIRALLALGQKSEARTRAAAFRARFPQSLLAPSLRGALTAADVSLDSETETPVVPQSNGVEQRTP